ncbi:MAG: hypothetical protein AAFV80_16875 [Bacteroidota bacterium]
MHRLLNSSFPNVFFGLCAALLFSCQPKQASETPDASVQTSDTLSFRLSPANNLILGAVLNGQDSLDLMFHTAVTGVSIIEASSQKLKSIQYQDSSEVKSWGGGGQARFSESNRLQIGSMNWADLAIWENQRSGPETDGKFGIDLFKDRVIEMDFDRGLLMLHHQPPEALGDYQALPVRFEDYSIFIPIELLHEEPSVLQEFLFHSGYGGSILFDDAFVNASQLNQQLEIIDESTLNDAYGNVLKTKKAIFPAIHLGGQRLDDVPCTFFEGSIGRQKMSVLGGQLIQRYNWMIDWPNGKVYLKPNSLTSKAFG